MEKYKSKDGKSNHKAKDQPMNKGVVNEVRKAASGENAGETNTTQYAQPVKVLQTAAHPSRSAYKLVGEGRPSIQSKADEKGELGERQVITSRQEVDFPEKQLSNPYIATTGIRHSAATPTQDNEASMLEKARLQCSSGKLDESVESYDFRMVLNAKKDARRLSETEKVTDE